MLHCRVFFPGGTGGQAVKNFARSPPTDHLPCFLTWAHPPPEFCPWKFQKFYLIFLSIFDYLIAQNTQICSNFPVGGIFGLCGQFFQVATHLTLSLMRNPPIWLRPRWGPKIVPKSKSPHQKFCEKPLHYWLLGVI